MDIGALTFRLDDSERFDSMLESFATSLIKRGVDPARFLFSFKKPNSEIPYYDIVLVALDKKGIPYESRGSIRADFFEKAMEKERAFAELGYRVLFLLDGEQWDPDYLEP